MAMSDPTRPATERYDGTEYKAPDQEIWYVISRNDDQNRIRIAPEAYSTNRIRAREVLPGKEVRIDDRPIGSMQGSGRATAKIQHTDASRSPYADLEEVCRQSTLSPDDFEDGMELYKSAETDSEIFLTTTKPRGFEHEEPVPVDELDDDDADDDEVTGDWSDADTSASVSDPTAKRIPKHATEDDLTLGEKYIGEVNGVESFGVFVSLPEDDPHTDISGLVHESRHDADLQRFKTGDQVVVALAGFREDAGPTFVITDVVDALNDITIDRSPPEQLVRIDDEGNRQPMNVEVDDAVIEAAKGASDDSFHTIPDAPDIKTMSTDELVSHIEMTSTPDVYLDALDDKPDKFDADAAEVRRRYEIRQQEGSLAHTFAGTDTPEYTDLGESTKVEADGGVVRTPGDIAQPEREMLSEITAEYASSDALKSNAQPIFNALRTVGLDIDPADYIRQRFMELDDAQQREFLSEASKLAESGDIDTSLYIKLSRELL